MQGALIRFMKTGHLGPLNCGLFREDVRRLFGDPLGWDGREAFSKTWRYEALKVEFADDHRVVGYGLGFWPAQRLPDCLDDIAGLHYVDTTMEEVRQLLNTHGIPFEEGRSSDHLTYLHLSQPITAENIFFRTPRKFLKPSQGF